MSAYLNAADLRAIADALDTFTTGSRHTGVTITSYGDEHITFKDHIIRMRWTEPDEEDIAKAGRASGHYEVEIPDEYH